MRTLLYFFQQNANFNYLSLVLLLTLLLFLTSWLLEPRQELNGLLFTIFLVSLTCWLFVIIFPFKFALLRWLAQITLCLLAAIIIFIVAFAWLFFLWNAYFVWKYESHTLPNLLTLFIGILLIIAWGIILSGPVHYLPTWLFALLSAAPAIAIYLLIAMYNFLISSLLYQFCPRHYRQDYLIVLGAGLINGDQVSSLLAARIDRAIDFALKQKYKGRKMPKLIMSGGQGPDETISEAQAMATYAESRGIPAKNLLLEEKSRNTQQNMLYSKALAIKDYGSEHFKVCFFSNNFHIFRAGLYAKKAKLAANGIPAYTRFYFLPNAIIREFAGTFVLHKRRHFAIIIAICLIFIVQAILIAVGWEKWTFI